MSGIFQQVMYVLGVRQIKSSAYHPESQGALERFQASLKTMIRAKSSNMKMTGMSGYHC